MKVRNSYFEPMVIGYGLLAQAFRQFADDDRITVFASGVSNSGEKNPLAYEREIKLLGEAMNRNGLLVYFSTVSVYDPTLSDTEYILHKRKAEAFIQSQAVHYLIFRLPILVGRTANPHTLTNYLYHRIRSGERFEVFTHACRYLMDVDDVANLLRKRIANGIHSNEVMDVCFENRIYIPELINIFEKVLGAKSVCIEVDRGACYSVPNDPFLEYYRSIGGQLPDDYIERVIRKYYS